MWTSDKIIHFIADAYYNATFANVDMRNVTEALESLRGIMLKERNIFKIWDSLDDQIGQASSDRLQSVLISIRNRFEKQVIKREVTRLEKVFKQNPQSGWKAWLKTYVEALTFWRVRFCYDLTNAQLPFSTNKEPEIEKFRKISLLSLHQRWAETYNFYLYLAELKIIPDVQRAKLYVALGEIQLYHLLNSTKALKFFKYAEELTPKEGRICYGLGEYWLNEKNFEMAKNYFQKAIENAPYQTHGYVGMGNYYEKLDNLNAAEEWYRKAIKTRSGESDGYVGLIRVYGNPLLFETHKELIEPLIKKTIAVNPAGEYQVYLEVGYIYQKNMNYDQAHQWFQKAIDLDKTRIDGYISKGYAYILQGKYDQVSSVFQKAIKLAPEAYDGYWGMAWFHAQQEHWKKALHFYKESLKRHPEGELKIKAKIILVKWNIKPYVRAIKDLIGMLSSEPNNEFILDSLIQIAKAYYKEHENIDLALHIFGEIRKIKGESYEPKYQNYVGNIKYYYSQYEEAVKAYRKAIVCDPNDIIYHSNLAGAYREWKKWSKAIKEVKIKYKLDNDWDEYNKEMGRIYNEQGNEYYIKGDFKNAISSVKEAINWDPQNTTYTERLNEIKFASHFGEQFIERYPVVTPIAMEVAENLLPYVYAEGNKESMLSNMFADCLEKMRGRILDETGVRIPGIRFRGNETELPEGTYNIIINEISIKKGSISLEKGLFPDKLKELIDQRITRELEKILRSNLSEFFGHQEIMLMLLDCQISDVYDQMQKTPERLSELAYVIRSLLDEEVPIKAFEKIVKKFLHLREKGKDLLTIIEAIRSHPDVRNSLPGNNINYFYHQLGRHFEEIIEGSINSDSSKSILIMKPEDCMDSLTYIRNHVDTQRNMAILVKNANIRPFVKKLIDIEFPDIPVLSKSELQPYLKNHIEEEIEWE
jgi:tetratricopeptide (TPR) repeat protein